MNEKSFLSGFVIFVLIVAAICSTGLITIKYGAEILVVVFIGGYALMLIEDLISKD